MAVPHWTLDNTNVSTVKNIYCKTFFFVLEYLMHIKKFQKNLAAWLLGASVPVRSFHPSLSSAIKRLRHNPRFAV